MSSRDTESKVNFASVVLGGTILLIGATAGICMIVNNSQNDKAIASEKAQFEELLAMDANVEKFNLSNFDWLNENSDYFFVFTGDALKKDNQPIEFISSKYKISQENYNSMVEYLNTVEGKNHKDLYSKLLEIVLESELVDCSKAEALPAAVYNQESGDITAIRSITKPVINRKNSTVEYTVELMQLNLQDKDKNTINFTTKKVSVPLTKNLEKYPTAVFLADKEDCKVSAVDKSSVKLNNNDYFVLADEEVEM